MLPPPPEPIVVEPARAFHVLGPTTPSTPMPAADCRERTALLVARPNTPSTVREAPEEFSWLWRVRTASPRSPERSFGWLEPEVAGALVPPPE